MSQPPDNGRVGYGRPPVESQFKKGTSGNYLGRPPKKRAFSSSSSNVNAAYRREAGRLIKVKEEGCYREVPVLDLTLRQLSQAAVRGDAKARRELITGLKEAERESQGRDRKIYNAALEYVTLLRQYQDHPSRPDSLTQRFLIDPDDLIFDHTNEQVEFSARLKRRARCASTALIDFRNRATGELVQLREIAAMEPSNVALKKDIAFVESMLASLPSALL